MNFKSAFRTLKRHFTFEPSRLVANILEQLLFRKRSHLPSGFARN